MQSFANWPIVVIAPINVAELGTGVCRMEYFTEREFSGIFSLAGGGILRLQKGNSRWPWLRYSSAIVDVRSVLYLEKKRLIDKSPSAADLPTDG